MAHHALRAYLDGELWRSLSTAGQELINERCSSKVASEQLKRLLDSTVTTVSGRNVYR